MSPRTERRSPSFHLPGWAIPLLIAALAAIQLAAFRWGVILPDTVVQYAQALSGDYADWHPPAMAWLWRWLGAARFGSAPMLLLDMALLWTGLGLVATALRRRGMPWLALAAVAIGATPVVFGQIGAILKDTLLAALLVAAAGVATCIPERLALRRTATLALFLTLLALASDMRVNAPLAVAPLLLLTLPKLPGRPATFGLALLVALATTVATNRLIDQIVLQPRPQHPLLSQINIDLAGIALRSGDNVYPPAARPDPALLAVCYTPAQFNPRYDDRCNAIEEGLHTLYDTHDGAVRLWLGAIAAHPLAYAAHRLMHFNANQRWLVGGVPDDAIYITRTANDLGLDFHADRLTTFVYRAATWWAWSPLGRPATWLAVAAALLLLRPAPLPAMLALSALLYGGGYAVASVAPDLRYNLWTMLAAMLACVTGFATGTPSAASRGRVVSAIMLVLGTVAAELAALITA